MNTIKKFMLDLNGQTIHLQQKAKFLHIGLVENNRIAVWFEVDESLKTHALSIQGIYEHDIVKPDWEFLGSVKRDAVSIIHFFSHIIR